MVIMYLKCFISDFLKLILSAHFYNRLFHLKGFLILIVILFKTITRDQRPKTKSTCEKIFISTGIYATSSYFGKSIQIGGNRKVLFDFFE